MMWVVNLVDVLITERGLRSCGLLEGNLFLSWLMKRLGWGWFPVLKVGVVSWLLLCLFAMYEIEPFQPFAWISAILALILLLLGCLWNIRLVLAASRSYRQEPV